MTTNKRPLKDLITFIEMAPFLLSVVISAQKLSPFFLPFPKHPPKAKTFVERFNHPYRSQFNPSKPMCLYINHICYQFYQIQDSSIHLNDSNILKHHKPNKTITSKESTKSQISKSKDSYMQSKSEKSRSQISSDSPATSEWRIRRRSSTSTPNRTRSS